MMRSIPLYLIILFSLFGGCETPEPTIDNGSLKLGWTHSNDGWKIKELKVKEGENWKDAGRPSGEYTLLFSAGKPDSTVTLFKTNTGLKFPEAIYRYQQDFFKSATQPVSLNTAGEAYHFYPQTFSKSNNEIVFEYENEVASVSATWKADPQFRSDIVIEQKLVARRDGYYSLASPSLFVVDEK
ncbi:MAG: glycerophosphoryl diester phosphodiesterase, partial [Marivirga sp.]|nr:glycerophosphoryl diester phosphodiesterase [Marivirga sp.]